MTLRGRGINDTNRVKLDDALPAVNVDGRTQRVRTGTPER
jgi:hypothetical protein